MIAVNNPIVGVAPDAMAKAMESGTATTATVKPDKISLLKKEKLYPCFKYSKRIGWNIYYCV